MAALYPSQIRTFTNPTATDYQDVVSHASQHSLANDEVNAIETYLGTGVQGTYINVRTRLGSVEGTIALIAGTVGTIGGLDNATIGTPAITGGTANLITLGSPTIVGGNYTSGTFVNGISIKDKGTISQSGTADHISLVPGASKTVRFTTTRKDNTTDSYQNNCIIQSGWFYLPGNGTETRVTGTVTFPIPFTSIPIVCTNYIATSGTNIPTSIGDFTTTTDAAREARAYSIGTASCIIDMHGEGAFEVGNYGISWIAIGSL